MTPTLVGSYQTAYLDETEHDGDEYRRYLTEAFMAPYAPRGDRILKGPAAQRLRMKEDFARVAAQIPEMAEAGVTLLEGSDSAPIAIYVYPGLALHQELQLFQEARPLGGSCGQGGYVGCGSQVVLAPVRWDCRWLRTERRIERS